MKRNTSVKDVRWTVPSGSNGTFSAILWMSSTVPSLTLGKLQPTESPFVPRGL